MFTKLSSLMLRALIMTTLVTSSALTVNPVVMAADIKIDEAYLKENNLLVKENRVTAIGILESVKGDTDFGSVLEKNHILFLENQLTFKAIAAKLGAVPVETPPPTAATLVEQNNAILLQNRDILKGAVEKLGIILPAAPAKEGSFAQQNNVLLKSNKALLAKIIDKMKGMKM